MRIQSSVARRALTLAVVVASLSTACAGTESVSSAERVEDATATPRAPATRAPIAPTATSLPPATTVPVEPTTSPESEPEPTTTPTPIATPECQLVNSGAGERGDVALAVEVVASNLEIPWGLAILPSGDLLVTERPGRLRLIRDGVLIEQPVLEIEVSDPDPLFGNDRLGFEGGLLDVVLHPDFGTNQKFYLFVNVANTDGQDIGRLLRYVLSDDDLSATLDRVILDEIPTGIHHQGGRMKIGPDGLLYVTVGAYEPADAQNPDTLAGKLLRLGLDGQIPADNPDPTSYVYVSGIRNSQGFDWFDESHIVMVEHGPSGLELGRPDLRGFDELNVAVAGDNLGWPRVWGCDEEDEITRPVLTWTESVPPTGAVMYRGNTIPEWTNSLLFTTVGRALGQHLHRVELDPANPYRVTSHQVYLPQEYGRLRTIIEAPDGRLYVMTSNCDGRGQCPAQRDVILAIEGAG